MQEITFPTKRVVPQISTSIMPQIGISTPQTFVLKSLQINPQHTQIETSQFQIKELQDKMINMERRIINMEEEMIKMNEILSWIVKRKQEKDDRLKNIALMPGIPTTGTERITRQQAEALNNEELNVMIRRLTKNVSNYKIKYAGSKQEEIQAMSDNLLILRSVRDERKNNK